jgi:AMMECR1 domain-containing protein
MASAKTRGAGLDHGLCAALARPLTGSQRSATEAYVRKLLDWQRTFGRWPAPVSAPDATPFVTLYAGGVLRGCFGSHEGKPGERLARAFVRALEDSRYGQVRAEERADLVAVVSYVTGVRTLDADRAHEQVEVGREGLGVTRDGHPPIVLLPSVARDQRAGPRQLMTILAKKCGVSDWRGAKLFAVTTDEVVVRSPTPRGAGRSRIRALTPRDQAAAWLARLVGDDGAVAFAVEARRRQLLPTGAMHHGRAASVVRALEQHGGYPTVARRATDWLAVAISDALGGKPVVGWPTDPAMVAGTLALAHMAGVPVGRALHEVAESEAVRQSAWHAAQVATALGREAPDSLWRACVAHLASTPWSPWTLLAARARGDAAVVEATAGRVVASLREGAPHEGGCGVAEVPETAVTALAVEALDGLSGGDVRRATERGRSFLRARQLLSGAIPGELDPEITNGSFAASPVVVDLLRCDVAGHAFSALFTRRRSSHSR